MSILGYCLCLQIILEVFTMYIEDFAIHWIVDMVQVIKSACCPPHYAHRKPGMMMCAHNLSAVEAET